MSSVTRIYKDYEEFQNRTNKLDNGVSIEFAQLNPRFKAWNATNSGEHESASCEGWAGGKGCYYCTRCVDCIKCKSGVDIKSESNYKGEPYVDDEPYTGTL